MNSARNSVLKLRSVLLLAVVVGLATSHARAQNFAVRATGSLPPPGAICGTYFAPVVADFDGSGLPDVVVADEAGAVWLVNDPGVAGVAALSAPTNLVAPGTFGSFAPVRIVAQTTTAGSPPDLAVLLRDPVGAYDVVRMQNAGGVFSAPVAVSLPIPPDSPDGAAIAAGDFDADGVDELAVARSAPISAPILGVRQPSFTFVHVFKFAAGTSPIPLGATGPYPGGTNLDLASADFDGDGYADAAMGYGYFPGAAGVYFMSGNPTGVPSTATVDPAAGTAVRFEAVGDLDADGLPDLCVWSSFGVLAGSAFVLPETAVLWGGLTGLSPWAGRTTLPLGYDLALSSNRGPTGVVGDADADGIRDLVFARTFGGYSNGSSPPKYSTELYVRRGLGGRAFGGAWRRMYGNLYSTTQAHALALGDLDGDGDVDAYGAPRVGAEPLSLENEGFFGVGCGGPSGNPTISTGTVVGGNLGFAVNAAGFAPNALAVFALSFARTPASYCDLLVDLAPGNLLLPQAGYGFVVTDAAGAASLALPIPAGVLPAGTLLYAQVAAVDPAGGFLGQFALTRGVALTFW